MADAVPPEWDYIIVGAGSAGCVLANRLSADPALRVLLIEAGPRDTGPLFSIPKGFAKTLGNPAYAWHYKVEPSVPGGRVEVWPRGKVLGGSSAVNGMMYLRGHPDDYEGWAQAGLINWGWTEMERCFREVERLQGAPGGPLDIMLRPPQREPVCGAFIAAGEQAGLPRNPNLSAATTEAVGFLPATIRNGVRRSAADAFLAPARKRRNLHVETGLVVTRVLFEAKRAVGVEVKRPDGSKERYLAAETILCAGGIQSPKLLQLSGIGPAELLRAHGIPVVHALPGVGANMLEHRLLGLQFRIKAGGYNAGLRGLGLWLSVVKYLLLRRGPLATGAYNAGALIKTDPNAAVPDSELLMGPYSVDPAGGGLTMEREAGLRIISFALRPRSQGSVSIASPDPAVSPRIVANHLADPYDRAVSVGSVRFIRRLASMPALASIIVEELSPGPSVQSDEDVITAYDKQGVAGMHASSTCRMGIDEKAVVAPDLRVHGVQGLSVMDCSVLPSMVSGNTNGPVMAMAWRAAELIHARRGS